MNRAFDYNGVQISASKPVQKLVTRTRVLHIDSRDRDINLYPNNGNFTLYLPRAYERVTSINIQSAEFPAVGNDTGPVASVWTGPDAGPTPSGSGALLVATPTYFFMESQGLNMADETANTADRSASTNSVFAKFVVPNSTDSLIEYNESSNALQKVQFYPALTKLDRFLFKLRTHTMNRNQYMYWPNIGENSPEWSMTLEIETLENSFDEFSTIETRIADRA
jgi:hypothetical protein